MYFSVATLVLLAAGSAQQISAHVAFTNFFVDGVNQGDGTAVRMSNDPAKATFPLPSITTPDMACGANGENGVSRVAAAKSGSTLTFEYRAWPDGSQSGTIDISHKGPCAIYMKKVDDATASNNAAGDGWFKIMENGYDSNAKKWCTEQLIPNNGHLGATIPKDLAAGMCIQRFPTNIRISFDVHGKRMVMRSFATLLHSNANNRVTNRILPRATRTACVAPSRQVTARPTILCWLRADIPIIFWFCEAFKYGSDTRLCQSEHPSHDI